MSGRKYLLRLTNIESHCIGSEYINNIYNLMDGFSYDGIIFEPLTMESINVLQDTDYMLRVLNFLKYAGVESKKDIDSLLANSIL